MRRAHSGPDERAVSPVIGVVLLVGIAVTLMASIGLFVLGFGPGEQTPRGEVFFEQDGDDVAVVVTDGTGLFADDLTIQVDGTDAASDGCLERANWQGGLHPGDNVTVTGPHADTGNCDGLKSGQVVRVVWYSGAGGRSEILAQWEVL